MGLDRSRYHAWTGSLRSPWLASLAMVRVALRQVFRRKLYWFVLGVGLLHFLLIWGIIYAVMQLPIPDEGRQRLLVAFGFGLQEQGDNENGYIMFIQRQGVVVMLLLAFSGHLLVGSDFRERALPFYLSRRIDRRHYIFAKLLSIAALIALLTIIPALALFFEYGALTGDLNYWFDNRQIAYSILGYGLVMCSVLGILLMTIAAYLQRAVPIAITWVSMFALLAALGNSLHRSLGNWRWKLLDIWRDLRYVARWIFDDIPDEVGRRTAEHASIALCLVCAIALVLLVRRVRAVDVVE